METDSNASDGQYSGDGNWRWDGKAWQPTGGNIPPPPPTSAKKKRRIFLWFFLAVQAIFLFWVIGGIASGSDPTDCGSLSDEACNSASDIGTSIGVFIIIIFWMIVDFLLAVGYGIYRLAKRP